jgi:uncharacterized membrane protein
MSQNISFNTPLAFGADRRARDAHEEAMHTRSTEERPLYAVAAEEWDPITKEWGLIIRYNHSNNEHQARMTYVQSRGASTLFRIVAVARAIGFKVHDDHGLILSA